MEWLETQGYPFEMVVAREFQSAGFRVFQSDYYSDPETNTPREIDVIAYLQEDVGSCLVRISFCLECKSSQDKPWIIFTSEDIQLAPPARIVQRTASIFGTLLLKKLVSVKEVQSLNMFSLPQRAGYGITQAFTSGKDIPYEATVGAAKCAVAKALKADIVSKTQQPVCEIMFPIVVTNGKLFECHLNETNEVVISEIEMGVLVWRNPLARLPHTIIRISTVKDLPNLVQNAKEIALKLLNCKKEIFTVLEEVEKGKERGLETLLTQGKAKRK